LASAEDCGSGSFRLSRLLLDRWPLPARSSRSSRSPALSWPVGVDCSASPFHEMWAFVNFSSPSEHSRLCQNSSRSPKRPEFFLSWDSPACTPLPFVFRRVHSRKLALPSVRRCDPSNVFRPRGFAPPRRLAPRRLCGFVAPRCRPVGFVVFPGAARSPLGVRCVRSVPHDAVTPFEEFPSSAAVSASLHPLPSCRFRPSSGPDLPGCPGRLPPEGEKRGGTSRQPKPPGFLSGRESRSLRARGPKPPPTTAEAAETLEGTSRGHRSVHATRRGRSSCGRFRRGCASSTEVEERLTGPGSGRLRYFNRGGLDTLRRSGG
jgi:hypothetical protein